MKTFLSILAFLLPFTASANGLQCEAILASSSFPKGGVNWSFSPLNAEGSHGGAPIVFREGTHEIQVLANKQWLGISWVKEGKKIAEGVFVLGGKELVTQRVAILYDPSESGDQVSLGCSQTE
jgi:hypothetical protein